MPLRSLRFFCFAFLTCAVTTPFTCSELQAAELKNIIFMIGDGMGPEHIRAAGMFAGGPMSFESMPYQGMVTTFSASSSITDSAASATAMATGQKVNNAVISQNLPGDGSNLPTLLEHYKSMGMSTGLVTTAYITHATPAAFGAHESHRNNTSQIGNDYLTDSKPNVLLGGGGNGMSTSATQSAGYTTVTNASQMLALNANTETFVSGQFGSGHMPYELDGLGSLPHLSQMTTTALDILDNDNDGFFLIVEGAKIDLAAHNNWIGRNVQETIEFSNSVQVVMDWAANRQDTLIIVTADHETGGMSIQSDNGAGNYPTVTWSTTGHTGVDVPVYAWGNLANRIPASMDNTDYYDLLTDPGLTGDLDRDGFVGIDDLNIILAHWNTDGSADPRSDPIGDAFVGLTDVNQILANWNNGTPPVTAHHIPEPASASALSLICLVGLSRRR